jgi:hypothetical protein
VSGSPRPAALRLATWEEHLLRAALLEGDAAAAAWQELRRELDLDVLRGPAGGLLPRIYRNLSQSADPALPRLRGAYRRTWYLNQLKLAEAARALRRLHGAGIRPLLLKELPLTLHYAGDLGLRAIGRLGLWVPPARREEARRLLGAEGGAQVEAPTLGFELRCADDGAEDWWSASSPSRVGDVPARALGPADLLLLVWTDAWEHGVTPLRWAPDAFRILRVAGERLDWERLAARARKTGSAAVARACLARLVELLDLPASTATPPGRGADMTPIGVG